MELDDRGILQIAWRSIDGSSTVSDNQDLPNIGLPKHWRSRVKSAVLHVISLARWAALDGWSAAAVSDGHATRLLAENQRLEQHVALVKEELRIKDGRMTRIAPGHSGN